MNILEIIEKAKKGAKQINELERDIINLTQSMANLMNDVDKTVISACKVGLTVSFSVDGKDTVIGCFGNKDGIESALEYLQNKIKEEVK